MKVVCFIPIKTNNQRTPGKNTRPLSDGVPVCNLMFNTILDVPEIDERYCFCSDETIQKFLPEKIQLLKRSSCLDTPDTKGNDLVEAFIKEVDADIYVMAHVTAPFLLSSSISECISAVASGIYDSATTTCRVREFLWDDDGPINYDPANIVRTQDMPNMFRETTGVYVFNKSVFTEHHRRVGFKPFFKEVSSIEGLDIDYPDDFFLVDSVYCMKKYPIAERGEKKDTVM